MDQDLTRLGRKQDLFRPEVAEAQRRKLEGEVTLHQPVSFVLLTCAVAFVTASLIAYLVLGSFPRRETVSGAIMPDGGLVSIVATKSGVVESLPVHAGDEVKVGTRLATVLTDTFNPLGGLAAQQRREILSRIRETESEIDVNKQSNIQDEMRLRSKSEALLGEIEALDAQMPLRKSQLQLAQLQLDKVQPLVDRGFISAAERDGLAQGVLTQRGLIEQLKAQIAEKQTERVEVLQQIKGLPFSRDSEASKLLIEKSTLSQSLSELASEERQVLNAPTDGTVLGLNAHVGDSVAVGKPIAVLMPKGSTPRAEIMVPTKAAGFIKQGEQVRLMVDAFPYDKYGAIPGTIEQISWSPTAIQTGVAGAEVPGYRVVLALGRTSFQVYGKSIALQPGMTLRADILTDRRTLLEWALDPLLASERRAR